MHRIQHLPTLPSLLVQKDVPLIHRDLSWMQFNERVLDEARDYKNPLLERLKFLAISSSNLDEFFMIRWSSVAKAYRAAKRSNHFENIETIKRLRISIYENASRFLSKQHETLEQIIHELSKAGIHLIANIHQINIQQETLRALFDSEILPRLESPQNLTASSLLQLNNLDSAIIFPNNLMLRIPRKTPPILCLSSNNENERTFIFLDTFLEYLLPSIFSLPREFSFIRLTRDADFTFELNDADPETLPDQILSKVKSRESGAPTRLQIKASADTALLGKLTQTLKLSSEESFVTSPTLFLSGLGFMIKKLEGSRDQFQGIHNTPFIPSMPLVLSKTEGLFEALRQNDVLIHHPYDSFDCFINFIKQAANDPWVTHIEQTIYRTDEASQFVQILKNAASKKHVTVYIELRARFDELNNLLVAQELEKAGVDVKYGAGKLKLHAKVSLVTRQEPDGEKLYTHLSTGNYNAATARQYTDLAILTGNQVIGKDARVFFDALSKGQSPTSFRQLVVAPSRLSQRLRAHIEYESKQAKAGNPASIIAKVNALVDEGIIESLYEASQAGVKIDLIVRGACSLIPQVKFLSENIRVISIVDRFLEHSRIYYFGSANRMYLSSADWMPRNFFSRLEIAFPILDPKILNFLKDVVLNAYINDNVKARELTELGTWKRRVQTHGKAALRSQTFLANYLPPSDLNP